MQSYISPGEKKVGILSTYFGIERLLVTVGQSSNRVWIRPFNEPAIAVFESISEFNDWFPLSGYLYTPYQD